MLIDVESYVLQRLRENGPQGVEDLKTILEDKDAVDYIRQFQKTINYATAELAYEVKQLRLLLESQRET